MSGGAPPPASSPEVSRRMRRVRRRDTGPELRLRSELHRRGLRFRVDAPVPFLPRHRADVVFGPAKVAVFVDGCFWHGCPVHGAVPKSNSAWWEAKFKRVRLRDGRTDAAFREQGWTVVRIWEHDDPVEAADRVERAVVAARRPRPAPATASAKRSGSRV
jgi:DNA mismatch endonuclease, patch repair protein